jgi:Flp pilus assembly protein TadB
MDLVLLLVACGAVFAYLRRDRITAASARRRTLHRFVESQHRSSAAFRWASVGRKLRWTLPRRSDAKAPEVPEAVACADFLDNVERNVRLGRSLRSGILDAHALLAAGALREALEHTVLYCRTGAPLEELLARDHSSSTDSPDITFVVQSLAAAAAGGTGTAHALERAAWVLRERHVVREERRVHAAQAVLSARVMSWMPIGFGAIMLLTSPSVRKVVLFSPLGLVCVVIGVALNLIGRRWMGRITGAVA